MADKRVSATISQSRASDWSQGWSYLALSPPLNLPHCITVYYSICGLLSLLGCCKSWSNLGKVVHTAALLYPVAEPQWPRLFPAAAENMVTSKHSDMDNWCLDNQCFDNREPTVRIVPRLPCTLDDINVEHTYTHFVLSMNIVIVFFMLWHCDVMESGREGGWNLTSQWRYGFHK